jgi:hypothetical protein
MLWEIWRVVNCCERERMKGLKATSEDMGRIRTLMGASTGGKDKTWEWKLELLRKFLFSGITYSSSFVCGPLPVNMFKQAIQNPSDSE